MEHWHIIMLNWKQLLSIPSLTQTHSKIWLFQITRWSRKWSNPPSGVMAADGPICSVLVHWSRTGKTHWRTVKLQRWSSFQRLGASAKWWAETVSSFPLVIDYTQDLKLGWCRNTKSLWRRDVEQGTFRWNSTFLRLKKKNPLFASSQMICWK